MQIIIDLIIVLLLAAIPSAANYFLDYCLGSPMSDEPKTKEIFSRYSIWLAKRKLIQRGLLTEIKSSFFPLLSSDNPGTRADGIDQMKKTILISGRKFFNIEKALGMCPYCTNFWFSQIAALLFFLFIPLGFLSPFCFFVLIPIFSHSYLRKL